MHETLLFLHKAFYNPNQKGCNVDLANYEGTKPLHTRTITYERSIDKIYLLVNYCTRDRKMTGKVIGYHTVFKVTFLVSWRYFEILVDSCTHPVHLTKNSTA